MDLGIELKLFSLLVVENLIQGLPHLAMCQNHLGSHFRIHISQPHSRSTASVFKNGFLVASCGTKYVTHKGNKDQILLFEHAFELCVPTNTSYVFKRTLNTLSTAHTPQPKQVFLPVSLWIN